MRRSGGRRTVSAAAKVPEDKKNAGHKARQLFDFATIGGAITFQRGTAGRIRRRWEEVATKQTNSLLLICSAQRAYARCSRASLLCKKRGPRRALRHLCLAGHRDVAEEKALCPLPKHVSRELQGSHDDLLPCPGTRFRAWPRIACAMCDAISRGANVFSGSAGRLGEPAFRRSSARPSTAGSRGRRRCAPCSSAPRDRRNRCRSSAPPPRASTAPDRSRPR